MSEEKKKILVLRLLNGLREGADLTATERLVLIAICDREGLDFKPSQHWLSMATGLDARTIGRVAERLAVKGWLLDFELDRGARRSSGRRLDYKPNIEKVEALAVAHETAVKERAHKRDHGSSVRGEGKGPRIEDPCTTDRESMVTMDRGSDPPRIEDRTKVWDQGLEKGLGEGGDAREDNPASSLLRFWIETAEKAYGRRPAVGGSAQKRRAEESCTKLLAAFDGDDDEARACLVRSTGDRMQPDIHQIAAAPDRYHALEHGPRGSLGTQPQKLGDDFGGWAKYVRKDDDEPDAYAEQQRKAKERAMATANRNTPSPTFKPGDEVIVPDGERGRVESTTCTRFPGRPIRVKFGEAMWGPEQWYAAADLRAA